jgi:PTS system nitrogen regulatory IIA component
MTMDIADFLAPANVVTDLRVSDKVRLLHELSDRAAVGLSLDAGLIADALIKREQLGSTGLGDGMAIPHARLAAVRKPFGILARLKKPIDFDAIDGQPVDLVFLLLLPAATTGEPLNALACVSRRLREPGTLRALRTAADGNVLFRMMTARSELPAQH